MAEKLCPACGCTIVGAGYKEGGVTYCCEPCASGDSCECACCSPAEEPRESE